jgi:hypothetical protein
MAIGRVAEMGIEMGIEMAEWREGALFVKDERP